MAGPGTQGRKYFPYGEEATTTQQDRTKFATYYRNETTALDYANQRYYARAIGRFLTADPFGGSANPANPQSWNRYSYVQGDPVNANDPSGLNYAFIVDGSPAGFYGDFGGDAGGGGGYIVITGYQTVGWGPPDDRSTDVVPFINVLFWNWNGFGSGGFTGGRGGGKEPVTPIPELGGAASQVQKRQFGSAMKRAIQKLSGDCAKLFGENGLSTLEGATYTYGLVFKRDSAIPDPDKYAGTDPTTQTVTINSVGHFFELLVPFTNAAGEPGIRDWRMGTGLSATDFRAFVLLHELSHLTGKLGDDEVNPTLGDEFNKRILSDCFGKKNWNPNP